MKMQRKWLILLALVALLVVVVGLASLALDAMGGHPLASTSQARLRNAASATPALATTALPPTSTLVPADYIPQGWRQAGPSFAQDIAFAASNPAIGYICGSQSGTIMVATSSDYGATWSTPVAVDSGYDCAISIDPLHFGSVAMTIQPCSVNGCAPGTTPVAALERSGNGGTSWAQATLPPDGAQMGFGMLMAWADDTLFAQVLASGAAAPRHYLAASVAGGSFVWADAAVAFAQPTTQLSLLAGSGTTLYAGFVQTGVAATCMTPAPANVIATNDDGQTWSAMLFTTQGKSVTLSAVEPDGRTLVGIDADGVLLASRDGGQTWQAAPITPAQMQACAIFVVADGTFIAQFSAASAAGTQASEVAIALPGATSWRVLATGTTNIALTTLSPAATDQSETLWAMTVGNLTPFKLVAFATSA